MYGFVIFLTEVVQSIGWIAIGVAFWILVTKVA